jgi:hypothetical protein
LRAAVIAQLRLRLLRRHAAHPHEALQHGTDRVAHRFDGRHAVRDAGKQRAARARQRLPRVAGADVQLRRIDVGARRHRALGLVVGQLRGRLREDVGHLLLLRAVRVAAHKHGQRVDAVQVHAGGARNRHAVEVEPGLLAPGLELAARPVAHDQHAGRAGLQLPRGGRPGLLRGGLVVEVAQPAQALQGRDHARVLPRRPALRRRQLGVQRGAALGQQHRLEHGGHLPRLVAPRERRDAVRAHHLGGGVDLGPGTRRRQAQLLQHVMVDQQRVDAMHAQRRGHDLAAAADRLQHHREHHLAPVPALRHLVQRQHQVEVGPVGQRAADDLRDVRRLPCEHAAGQHLDRRAAAAAWDGLVVPLHALDGELLHQPVGGLAFAVGRPPVQDVQGLGVRARDHRGGQYQCTHGARALPRGCRKPALCNVL